MFKAVGSVLPLIEVIRMPKKTNSAPPLSFLRLDEVLERTGKFRSTLYAEMQRGEFPKSINTGPRQVAWVSTEIDAYMQARIQDRDRKEFPAPVNTGSSQIAGVPFEVDTGRQECIQERDRSLQG